MVNKLMDIISPNFPTTWTLLLNALSPYLGNEQLHGQSVTDISNICRSLMAKQIISYGSYDKLYTAVDDIDSNAAVVISSAVASIQALILEGKTEGDVSNEVIGDRSDKTLPIKGVYCTKFSSRIISDTKEGSYMVQRMVTLPNDRVIVLDRDNTKLKLFSSEYKFMHSVCVSGFPVGLTVVDESTVAVSDESTNCIALYTVHNIVNKSASIQCGREGGYLMDISYSNHHFICLKFNYADKVRTIERVSMTGQRETVFKGQEWCDIGYHVIARENRFYTTECVRDTVRCMTYDGKVLWKRKTPFGPMGITVVRGTLCVVALTKGVVCQLSLDGERYDHQVIQGVTKPYIYCICYQSVRKRLLVSSSIPGEPIKVYTIS
ncbi:uncharacterized protein LOC110456069 isoform X2 [Mizuhopecten yessoensis]|uniref:Uncharacterized protein n=2 Tax=Mizuhopecten yessoensis TaxID=6573 RepID=A0A210QBQ4_MIZYE|nr:uncharacterized protein LOC110456069 isoform X2 [Mizuhopecten yessoensis]OWF46164.1 hypothetical protein KP79_PYT14867 [Mizuhopecten yessoensis]